MLKEDYCSYEVAKLLKEKGFNGQTHGNMSEIPCVCYITYQMAMKWMRKKGWHIIVLFDYRYVDEKLAYIPVITPMKAGDSIGLKQGGFPTFKKAVEAALKYCLTELI